MSSGALIVVIVVAIAVIGAAVVVALRRRSPDDHVENFRRQIDALSPESRRPTIDQMKPSEPPSADDDGDNAP